MKLCLLLSLIAGSAFAQQTPTADETARFLAGLPVEGPLAPLMQTPGWQQHAQAMDEAWAKKEAQQILPIRDWMSVNAQPYFLSTETMYYMFAGPDFLYAHTFFPYANTYVLAGLEPIGQVGDLTTFPADAVTGNLSILRASLGNILRFQYFITKDMRAELGKNGVSGVLPLLYVFLARTGNTVLEVERLTSPAEGVRITFRDPQREQTQTLFYFKTDISGGNSAFLKWCAARGPGLSLLKAASFLMHGDGFNGVRNFLLENSRVIIQDDSGIPLRAFPKGWDVQCFGRYVPHRTEFAKYSQPDLLAFSQRNPSSPLGFAFGYHWQKEEGMLMMATPTGTQPAAKMPPVMKALPVVPEEQAQEARIRK
jgi:hypothetical protein